jgi:hypothetical protein
MRKQLPLSSLHFLYLYIVRVKKKKKENSLILFGLLSFPQAKKGKYFLFC